MNLPRSLGLVGRGILCVLGFATGRIQARSIPVDLPLLPPGPATNRLAATLTVYALGTSASDNDTATVTGNVNANLDISFDRLTHEVADVNSLAFTGGSVHLSDMSFTLNYGFLLGRIEARTTQVAGTPSSPSGPGPVQAGHFNTIDHGLVLNQGSLTAYGTGLVGTLFDPITRNLAEQPVEASANTVGDLSVRLESIDAQANYRVDPVLPVAYNDVVALDGSVTTAMVGDGVIEATGTFSIPLCDLRSDLAGDDCQIDLCDLQAFSNQWLGFSDQSPCPLAADIAGDDCHVDLSDLTILAAEWLAQQ